MPTHITKSCSQSLLSLKLTSVFLPCVGQIKAHLERSMCSIVINCHVNQHIVPATVSHTVMQLKNNLFFFSISKRKKCHGDQVQMSAVSSSRGCVWRKSPGCASMWIAYMSHN